MPQVNEISWVLSSFSLILILLLFYSSLSYYNTLCKNSKIYVNLKFLSCLLK